MGILTVAVVTSPFAYEGKRVHVLQAGLDRLKKERVDSLIIVSPGRQIDDCLGRRCDHARSFPVRPTMYCVMRLPVFPSGDSSPSDVINLTST